MATVARIAGNVKVDGAAASRKVIVISDNSSPAVLGSVLSASDGTFEIEYLGWSGPVIALALDEYGQEFKALTPLIVGNIIHPTIPNGYVYVVTADGTSGASEPVWPTSGSLSSGGAILAARQFFRPVASGPVQGEIIEDTPLNEDEYFKHVVALLHFNAANNSTVLTDERGANWSRVNNVVVSTEKSKFGGSSAKFTSGYISASRNDFALTRLSLMTIEFWVNFNSVSNAPHLFTLGASEANRISIYLSGGRLVFWTKTNSTNFGDRILGPMVITGTDYFIALTKSGDLWELFVNGVSYGTSITSIYPLNATPQIALGHMPYGSVSGDYLVGFMDDFRVTAWINRYADGCPVPASQFPDQGPA